MPLIILNWILPIVAVVCFAIAWKLIAIWKVDKSKEQMTGFNSLDI